jgi:hypothetical protein
MAPVPVLAVTPTPSIWRTLPVAAVLNVLLVSASVVALCSSCRVAIVDGGTAVFSKGGRDILQMLGKPEAFSNGGSR